MCFMIDFLWLKLPSCIKCVSTLSSFNQKKAKILKYLINENFQVILYAEDTSAYDVRKFLFSSISAINLCIY